MLRFCALPSVTIEVSDVRTFISESVVCAVCERVPMPPMTPPMVPPTVLPSAAPKPPPPELLSDATTSASST